MRRGAWARNWAEPTACADQRIVHARPRIACEPGEPVTKSRVSGNATGKPRVSGRPNRFSDRPNTWTSWQASKISATRIKDETEEQNTAQGRLRREWLESREPSRRSLDRAGWGRVRCGQEAASTFRVHCKMLVTPTRTDRDFGPCQCLPVTVAASPPGRSRNRMQASFTTRTRRAPAASRWHRSHTGMSLPCAPKHPSNLAHSGGKRASRWATSHPRLELGAASAGRSVRTAQPASCMLVALFMRNTCRELAAAGLLLESRCRRHVCAVPEETCTS